MHNYLPSQYNAADQNRCVIQDLYGRIFVANNDGVLINDGADWVRFDTPFLCLSLAKDESEQIFVAGDGNFGKIVQNKKGAYGFQSLDTLLPKKERELGRFWTIIPLKGHVYFCSNEKILDYDYKSIKTITAGEEGFHTFFKVEDHLIVREKGKGLKILSVNNELVFLKDGEQFANNDNPVRAIIKGKEKLQYIITPKGVYELNFDKTLPELSTIKSIKTPIDNWLNEKTVYCAANIGQSDLAFGSVNGGLLITTQNFKPVKYINSTNDLQDDGVNYIYNDVQGHIWLALAKGISFIEFNSPVTKFTKADGIIGTVEACIFYKQTPYLATDKGVLKYNATTLKFEETNLTERSWCIATVGEKLVVGSRYGMHVLDNDNFKLIYETPNDLHFIFVHPDKKDLIYIGTETGYAKGILNGITFTPQAEFFDLNEDIRSIALNNDQAIVFSTTESGIYIEKEQSKKLIHIDNKEGGLPNLKEPYLFNYGNKVLIATDTGVYALHQKGNSYFVSMNSDFDSLNKKLVIINKATTIKNDIWLTYAKKDDPRAREIIVCLEKTKNGFEKKSLQLSRIKESNVKSFCYNDSLVYIGTNNGLYCYDITLKEPTYFLNTIISSMSFGNDTSLIYSNLNPKTELKDIVLGFKNNFIKIILGASDYMDKNELQFQYYLEGRDQGFGAPTSNNLVKYDHLYEGDYVFHVKSKNILGVPGQEIKIKFTVLPPWYRTIWAYVIYALLFLLVVYLAIRLNSKRLIEQNIKLENIITDRTKEINKQKLEIEHKNHEITDSINYAKGIQDSILPGMGEVKKTWQDLFIFFQPKDIVSGDFYWFKQINNHEFLIACADCTGHGVPGGFMSMICSGKLHDAAKETTEPDKILFLANNSIKETLRQQNEGKSKDGMEICLLKINTQTREVKYAGANRPLWILNNLSKEVSEVKPTKASVASFTEFNFNYELHTLQLNENDVLYASTDGYPDQFGGPGGKKYMSKKMKGFLSDISDKTMPEQEMLLRKDINDWMTGLEQVDDLLVIGVKL